MTKTEQGTADRILQTAIQLMKDKGFKSVTIKEIAKAAQVSEMTIFRHFETKKNLLEAAIEKHSIVSSFQHIFENQLVWDLEQDLTLIATTYLELMEANRPIFLIATQERTTMPELSKLISTNPKQLKQSLSQYFQVMSKKKKANIVNPDQQATSFLTFLFGYFCSLTFLGDQFITETRENFIRHCVQTYCHGII
ncbi:TetR/AcrR family transcriptional regulator [Shimazuella kribbensis]|uniref:TetR/AcrR family transcriptional regulator n=1 Tax=Shimazuella kribbensis TaxID=139808 RepID=UPI0004238193|nr:TetR/AcrR family transcriptional regulator [Shimazuella kribbensis]